MSGQIGLHPAKFSVSNSWSEYITWFDKIVHATIIQIHVNILWTCTKNVASLQSN